MSRINNFDYHVKKLLDLGKNLLTKNPHLVSETGKINTKGDKTIAMDALIEQEFIKYLRSTKLPVLIYSEEIGIISIHPKPKYLVCFDPLDGSTNYRIGNNLLPYGILIAIYDGIKPKLNQVIAAGMVEMSNQLEFRYFEGKTIDKKGNSVIIKQDWPITDSTPLYLDLHKKDYYQIYAPIVQKLFIRNTGSTIGNLTYVLSNVACGMGHPRIKSEEIGAVYALIKGAGGVVVDHKGKDLGSVVLDLDVSYQLLGGVKNCIEFVVETI